VSRYVIFSCSLNPDSLSYVLASFLHKKLEVNNKGTLINLLKTPLPMCNGGNSFNDPNVKLIQNALENADGVVICTPIYNYNVNSCCKSLIEHGSNFFQEKVVGFACAAGGTHSYMSLMPTVNSLMLDYRCIILPRFLYATGEDFENQAIKNPDIIERSTLFSQEFSKLTQAVSS
jgi:NAD(P)H-dependent FMN reductase